MPNPLPALEAQRAELKQQISELGDMRPGSITTTIGRCGNPRCHCHDEHDPGHGPFYRLTRKVDGKTVTETFSSPAALQKAQREIAEYHRFLDLSRDLVDVNDKICRARPVQGTMRPEEKKRPKRSIAKSRAK